MDRDGSRARKVAARGMAVNMGTDWAAIVSLVIALGTPIALFLGRSVIAARITSGVQHRFNAQIEQLRTELRSKEEQWKSELRNNEAELVALRSNVLAGRANRQALLDKRRFEAVEKVWKAVNDLASYKWLSSMMAIMKYDAVAAQAHDPKMQRFLETIGNAPDHTKYVNVARDEQPFLPDLAWAYFQAYSTILLGNYARYSLLRTGMRDAKDVFDAEAIKKILRSTLPQFGTWIDSNDMGAYHYLLEHVEMLLLAELRKVLEGVEADQKDTAKAKAITDAIAEAKKEKVEANLKTAEISTN